MGQNSLKTVAELMRFECALCGRRLRVEELSAHADYHAGREECLSYSEYDCAGRLDRHLEGYALSGAGGLEVIWPFRLDSRELQAAQAGVPRAG